MAKFCLPKELADRLKQLAIEGKIDIQKMYDMTSAQRRGLFEQWVDKTTAQNINAGFEEAMISTQQNALRNWAKETFGGKKQNQGRKKDVLDKIDRLNELGVLTPANADAYLSDLVASRLGVVATAEEASRLAEMSNKLQELSDKQSEFGTPTKAWFKAKNEAENYIKSLDPTSRVKVYTSIIGRGSMLFSIKSPLLNIESNTIQAFLTATDRRLGGFTIDKSGKKVRVSGKMMGRNSGYSRRYMKFAMEVFKESGYDITRMRTLQGTQKVRGEAMEIHAQGKGKVRKVARFYEDVVFKGLMSFPDVAFSAFSFADSANLASTKIAKQEGHKGNAVRNRALEIFKDATRVDPKTKEGLKVREQAIADAEYATYTNDSRISALALGIRKSLNLVSGDYRLGDQMLPFVKTPANVIQAGLETSGVLLPLDTIVRTQKLISEIRKGETITEASKRAFDGVARTWIRAGVGITLAHLISSMFEPEDFIGEYPTSAKERELLRTRNATTNSVKIGNKWVSLDYFGALGAPLVGMLYAKKYGADDKGNQIVNYYKGVIKQAQKIPGLELTADIWESIDRLEGNELDEDIKQVAKIATDYLNSRTIPAFLYDYARASDEFERQTDKNKPTTSTITRIPGLRQSLPAKETVFGKPIKTESSLSVILFGSRVKTENQDAVVQEIIRLENTGNLPSITDSSRTSTRMKRLNEQVGDEKFGEARDYFQEEFATETEKLINKKSYKKLEDEKKADAINKVKEEALEKTLKKFKYKKPRKLGEKKVRI